MLYVPFAQAPLYGCEVVVRSTLSASAVVGAIRAVTHGIDKNLPVTDVASFPDLLNASVAQTRFRTLVLAFFGAIALLLAAVGIFGVISYSVSRRTHELGVRMALGATPAKIAVLILRRGVAQLMAGLGVGAMVGIPAARILSKLPFLEAPSDPAMMCSVAAVLWIVGLFACWLPARRAAALNPVSAIRDE